MGDKTKLALDNLNTECDAALDSSCKIEWKLLQELYVYARQNLDNIFPRNRYQRSICEWCGKLQHFMYGTVDADEAREMIGVINNSSIAIRENRKIINGTIHIVEAMLEREEKKVLNIQQTLNEIYTNTQTKINDKFKRRDIISITRSLIHEYEKLVESIDQSLSVQKGRAPQLMNAEEFKIQFRAIAKSFQLSKRFPIDVFKNDISEIFEFVSIKTTKIENKIILKITVPLCEINTYNLFKVTPVPILTDNVCLLANVENEYFIINREKTEYTEMTNEDIVNGIRMDDENVLYTVNALTKTNSKTNCIWSQFMNNDINVLTANCNLNPIHKNNYITTINRNDLFYITIVKPLIIWEICGQDERKYHINMTGFLQAKPKCLIRADDFIIKTHNNIKINFSASIQPFRFGGSFTNDDFENITRTLPKFNNTISTTMIGSKSKIESLYAEAREVIASANKELNLKQLTHGTPWFSFSFSFKKYIIIGLIIAMAGSGLIFMYYCQCLSFKCIWNLLRKKKKSEHLKLTTKEKKPNTKYRKTPYVSRKIMEENIVMGSESEEEKENELVK